LRPREEKLNPIPERNIRPLAQIQPSSLVVGKLVEIASGKCKWKMQVENKQHSSMIIGEENGAKIVLLFVVALVWFVEEPHDTSNKHLVPATGSLYSPKAIKTSKSTLTTREEICKSSTFDFVSLLFNYRPAAKRQNAPNRQPNSLMPPTDSLRPN